MSEAPPQATAKQDGPRLGRAQREMIESGGNFFQSLGVPRSVGQIYALFYLSSEPLEIETVRLALNLPELSIRSGLKQLLSWKVLKQIRGSGHPGEVFAANGDLGSLMRAAYRETVRPQIIQSQKKLKTLLESLEQDVAAGGGDPSEARFCASRLKDLLRMQKKILSLAPIAEKLL